MYQKVKEYIQKWNMISKGENVVVGVSGGADSVCLLFVLQSLREEMGFSLIAVHVHHGLRGADADADEQYVKELCEKYGVPLRVYHEDVKAFAREQGYGEEEAGRILRRRIFSEVKEDVGGGKIALAHHKNDNVETVFMNLCRGTGLKGLTGIAPKERMWIRPLLCVSRKEIESYLENQEINYCIDRTNLEDCYTRNKVRNKVIPYLEKEINEQTVEHINETAERLRGLEDFVEREVQRYCKQCVVQKEGRVLAERELFFETPEELRPYVIRQIMFDVAEKQKDIEAVHIRQIGELFEKQVGKRLNLPYGIVAERCYRGVEFYKTDNACKATSEAEKMPEYKCRIFARTNEQTFPESIYTKWFDYDIIKSAVTIRHRLPGDFIVIDSQGKKQKLKQYFINEKIPRELRDQLWVFADGNEIIWIVGYRQSQAYQITEHTDSVLEIKFNGGEDNDRTCESVD